MADIWAELLSVYFALEQRYYSLMDWIHDQLHLPVYEWYVEPIEKRGIPSFPVTVLLLVLLAVVLFLFWPRPPSFVTLSVHTFSATGEPLDDVRVSLLTPAGELKAVKRTRGGLTTFTELPPSLFEVNATKEQFKPASAKVDLAVQQAVALSLESAAVLAMPTPEPGLPTPLPYEGPTQGGLTFTSLSINATPTVPAVTAGVRAFLKNANGTAVDGRVKLFNAGTNQKLAEQETVSGSALFADVRLGLRVYLTAFASGYAPYDGSNESFAVDQRAVIKTLTLQRPQLPLGVPPQLNVSLRDSFGRSICSTVRLFGLTGAELFDQRACDNLTIATPATGTLEFREPGLLPFLLPAEVIPRLFDRGYDPARLSSSLVNATGLGAVLPDGTLLYLASPDLIYVLGPDGTRRTISSGEPGFEAFAFQISSQRLPAALLSLFQSVLIQLPNGNFSVSSYLGVRSSFLTPDDARYAAANSGNFTYKAVARNDSLVLLAPSGAIQILYFDGRVEFVRPGDAQYSSLKGLADATGLPATVLPDGTIVVRNADGTLRTYRFTYANMTVTPQNDRTWCYGSSCMTVNPQTGSTTVSLPPANAQNSVTLGVQVQREDGSLVPGAFVSVALESLLGRYVIVYEANATTGTAVFAGLPLNAWAQASASRELLSGTTYKRLNASVNNATVVLRLPRATVTLRSFKVSSPAVPVRMNHFALQGGVQVGACTGVDVCLLSLPIGLTTLVVNGPGLLPNATTLLLAAQGYEVNLTTRGIATGALCSDGTTAGACSLSVPGYFCSSGVLEPRTSLCGCPTGYLSVGEFCAPEPPPTATCADGTQRNACSASNPWYCTKDALLVENATGCGCPAGYAKQGETCVNAGAPQCADGTSLGACSSTKPYVCSADGRLTLNPQQCGCPAGFSIVNGQCLADQPPGPQPACSDGTAPGACSSLKPFACLNGALIPRAYACGCPPLTFQVGDYCADDSRVNLLPCADGTQPFQCSGTKPFRCEAGELLSKASACGCPAGYEQLGDSCRRTGATSCADGTSQNACSSSKPYFCDGDGQLLTRASLCGCPSGFTAVGDQCIKNDGAGRTCSDGTSLDACSSRKPLYCSLAGALEPRASRCGCATGEQPQGELCRVPGGTACADGTALNTCSATKPLYCNGAGALVANIASCGCPSGFVASGDQCFPSTGGALFLEGPFFEDEAGATLNPQQTSMDGGFYYVTFKATPVGPSSTIQMGLYLRASLGGPTGSGEYASLEYLDKDVLSNSGATLTHKSGKNPSVSAPGACSAKPVKYLNELPGSPCASGACTSTFSESYEWVEARINTTGAAPATFRFGVRVNVPPDGGARQLRFDYRGWALFPNSVFVRTPTDDRYDQTYVVGGANSTPTSAWCQANPLSLTREWNCGATGKQCCTNPPNSCPERGACSVTTQNPQGLCVNPTTCFNNQVCTPGNVCCIVGAAQTACTPQNLCSQVASCSPACQISQFCDARTLPQACKECDSLFESLNLCENCGNENELCCSGSACDGGLGCGGFVREKPCGSDPAKPILLGWRWTNLATGQGETYSSCGDVIVGVGSNGQGTSSTAVLPDPSCVAITGEQYLDSQNQLLPTGCFTRDATGFIRYKRQTGCAFDLSGKKTATVLLRAACFDAVPTKTSVRVTLAEQSYAQELLQGQIVYREARSSAGGLCVNAAQRWTQKLDIRVENPSAQPLYNYPVQVLFDGAGPISRGELQTDGRDLRLASVSGFQKDFPFLLVPGTLNTNKATLWFRLDELGPGESRNFSLFYGNPQATAPPALSSLGLAINSNNTHWLFPGAGADWGMFSATGQEWRLYVPTGIATLTSTGSLNVDSGAYNWILTTSAGPTLLSSVTAQKVAQTCTVTDATLCGTTCNTGCTVTPGGAYGTCTQTAYGTVVYCPANIINQYLQSGTCTCKYYASSSYCTYYYEYFGGYVQYSCNACPPCGTTTNTCAIRDAGTCGFTEAPVTLNYQSANNVGGSTTASYSLQLVSSCPTPPCTSTATATLSSAQARIQNPVRVYVNGVLITDITPPPVLQDVTPPEISQLEVLNGSITGTSAVVQWLTNEGSDSQVFYGTTASLGSNTSVDATLKLLHQVTVTGLTPGTQYLARARSCDSSGNCALSGQFVQFTTPVDNPPTVTLVDPLDGEVKNESTDTFRFVPSDDKGISRAEVWMNKTGSWAVAASRVGGLFNNEQNAINVTGLANGAYRWNVRACDTADQCVFASANRTLIVSLPTPAPAATPGVQGNTSLVAGSLSGYSEGTGSGAQFSNPAGLALSGSTLYVTDTYNNRIRRIDLPTATTSLLAGDGTAGLVNSGDGSTAKFNSPQGLALSSGFLYVTDYQNQAVRRVNTASGATQGTADSGYPLGVAVSGGFEYVSYHNVFPPDTIKKINMDTGAFAGSFYPFSYPTGLAVDGGYLYVAESYGNRIRRVDLATSAITTVAGQDTAGYLEGIGAAALFNNPQGVAVSGDVLYVADTGNHRIRRIILSTGATSLVAGDGTPGYSEGIGSAARFKSPTGLAATSTTLYVADSGNNRIRRIV